MGSPHLLLGLKLVKVFPSCWNPMLFIGPLDALWMPRPEDSPGASYLMGKATHFCAELFYFLVYAG